MSTPLSRDQFWYMHLVKCDECRTEWLDLYEDTDKTKRSKLLEQIIYANHEDYSNIN